MSFSDLRQPSKASPQVHHAHEHRAPRIERQILTSESRTKSANAIIQRMRDYTNRPND